MGKSRSQRYINLVKEIHALRIYLLPNVFDPAGDYTQDVLVKALAFRVLAHAGLESYMEESTLELAKAAVKAWKREKRASCTLMGLLAFSGQSMDQPPKTLRPEDENRSREWNDKIHLSNKIDNAMRAFVYMIHNNNGIKEKNVLGLLLPVGFDANALDHTWLLDMDNFGESRGDAAHKSTGGLCAGRQINPADEWQAVKSLLRKGLCKVDDNIERIINEL
jgi:hypothetical protein